MFKMGSHDPFEYLQHKLWSKEEPWVKVSIWLSTIKVENRFEWHACKWCATYHWIALDKGHNFALNLTSIGGLHKKWWASKWQKSQFQEFRNSWLGNLGKIDIWVQPLWLVIENIIRGKVVASPKSRPWWVLCICVCPWFIHAPKMFQLCINQLIIWFLQVHTNNWPIYHSS
jgi:hypothetical protein